MSDTASFVDPVFLARFGLARMNVLDYFLHPLNPFRTKATNTSNEVLSMQGITIGMLMQYGTNFSGGMIHAEPMSAINAEEEYNNSLKRLNGEQYHLLPPNIPLEDKNNLTKINQIYMQPAQLYVIRHIMRSSINSFKVLGIYYIVEGIIYKSPAVRSVGKTNIARTISGLIQANEALSICARFLPSTGYTWIFEDALGDTNDVLQDSSDSEGEDFDETTDENNDNHVDESDTNTAMNNSKMTRKKKNTSSSYSTAGMDPVKLYQLCKKRKRRKILDHRKPGERAAAEEEGIRASESIDQILVRISRSSLVVGNNNNNNTITTTGAVAVPTTTTTKSASFNSN